MFERQTVPAKPKPTKKHIKRPRLSKKSIKFRLLPEDKRLLQFRALDNGASLTAFCSDLIKRYLSKDIPFDEYEYDHNGKFIQVLLDEDSYKQIENLHIEWDLSRRQTVHRIIKEYINREFGGFEFVDYREAMK